jgi:hypothetical protein
MRTQTFRLWALCLAALVSTAAAEAADVQRIESLGAAPLGVAGSERTPRDAALRAALASAVRQVAAEQLSGLPASPPESVVEAALGEDPFEYASRFRVLEDKGARPAVLIRDPDVTREYVVLAEVHVDAARVRQRLATAGLLQLPSGDRGGVRTRIALEELTSWGEVQAVRQLLRDLGATHTLPVEVERGRAVLEVESSRSPARLLQELVRRAPTSLELEPLGSGPGELRLRARVLVPTPPAALDDAETFDTPEAERY